MQRNIGDFYNYAEIGDVLSLAPETVRQIEKKALLKLHKVLKRRGLAANHFFDACVRRSGKP